MIKSRNVINKSFVKVWIYKHWSRLMWLSCFEREKVNKGFFWNTLIPITAFVWLLCLVMKEFYERIWNVSVLCLLVCINFGTSKYQKFCIPVTAIRLAVRVFSYVTRGIVDKNGNICHVKWFWSRLNRMNRMSTIYFCLGF